MKNMRLVKKLAAVGMAAAMAAAATGCSQLETKSAEDTVAATFGDKNIMLDEVMYYVHELEYVYESYFGTDICKQEMGDGTGRTVGEYIVETAMTELRQTKVLCNYAEEKGIAELTDEQKQKVEDAVDEVVNERPEYMKAVDITRDELVNYYTENAIANVAYLKIIEDVDTTVDDDEFLRKSVMFVRLTPNDISEITTAEETSEEDASDDESASGSEAAAAQTKSDEAAGTEAASEEETLSDAELARNEAMDTAAAEILKHFEDGEDAADFIDDYKSDTYYSATYSTVDIAEDGTAAYNETAWKLATDECATYTTDEGSIYVLRCLNDDDEEARQEAIDEEIASRKTEHFAEEYAQIEEDSPKFKADEDVIDAISLSTPIYEEPSSEEASEDEATESVTEAAAATKTEEETEESTND